MILVSPDSGPLEALVERLLARVRERESVVVQQRPVIAEQADRIVELERRWGRDSWTSSRPPSSDAPWEKQPAKKGSSQSRSGRKPGKQPGSPSASRSVVNDLDETFEVAPDRCARCEKSLDDAAETARVRRQVQGVEGPDRELWDTAQMVGHLVSAGSMFGFVADHRAEVFPDEQYADLFSAVGRPSLPATRWRR